MSTGMTPMAHLLLVKAPAKQPQLPAGSMFAWAASMLQVVAKGMDGAEFEAHPANEIPDAPAYPWAELVVEARQDVEAIRHIAELGQLVVGLLRDFHPTLIADAGQAGTTIKLRIRGEAVL